LSTARTRLLVVGGTGFVGSNVARRARSLGWDVVTLGVTGPAREGHISVDFRNSGGLQRELIGLNFDYVVNCGGYVDHRSMKDGGRAVVDAHFTGLVNLVECLGREGLKAFVNIGSSDEYGPATAPQTEGERERPISPYSFGKTAATHYLQMLHRTEQFPATTLRLFLTYGPGQDKRRLIPQIATACMEGRHFPTSFGEQLRDFCYIDDTVDAIFAALHTQEIAGEVLNIGSGRPVAIRDVVMAVRDVVGGGTPDFGAIAYRVGENMALYADTAKAKQLLNWSATTGLEEGIRRTVAHLRGSS